MPPEQDHLPFFAEDLRPFITAMFKYAGLPEAAAAMVADCLVLANLRGVDSHGVSRAPNYLRRLRRGAINPRPDIDVVRLAPSVASVAGDNGMGAVVGTQAMNQCIALASDAGVGVVSVRRSTHFGMAAYYVLRATRAGMVGIALSNASPALPPWGGRMPFFGTNPLAVGVPAGKRPAYVLDMAMSVMARGKIYAAAEEGQTIAEGVALDADGRSTTDPNALINNGAMLAFGGAKGAALAMLVDLLSGVMTGAGFGDGVVSARMNCERPQDVGHLFITLRPDLFMPREAFLARVNRLIEQVKAQPKASGFNEILIPGERRARAHEQRSGMGIPLPSEVVRALKAQANLAGIAFPPRAGARHR